MKRYFYFTAFFMFFSALLTFAQDEEQVNKELQEKYISFLKEEGFSPIIDSDGDVKFKNEGETYYIRPTNDKKYFQVMKILNENDPEKFVDLLKSANATMIEYKQIKIVIYKKKDNSGFNGHFKSDNFLGNEDDFKKIFYRSMKVIQASIKFFKEDYNK